MGAGSRYIESLLAQEDLEPVGGFVEQSGPTSKLAAQVHARTREALRVATMGKHYALCAACALFTYIEQSEGQILPQRSVPIVYQAPEGTLFMDASTLHDLGIMTTSTALDGIGQKGSTLYDMLNLCRTPMGSRLLKVRTIVNLRSTPRLILTLTINILRADESCAALKRSVKARACLGGRC